MWLPVSNHFGDVFVHQRSQPACVAVTVMHQRAKSFVIVLKVCVRGLLLRSRIVFVKFLFESSKLAVNFALEISANDSLD